ncbi:MAG: hypothetical protein ACRCST_15555 [Turicibacter sp.]
MSYEKQTWNQYDELKTEEENIKNGAVVTDNRMNHIEEGIYSHTIDKNNPHKVTAAQAGLGNVKNFGLATEDEAKQGISNAKYMTPSLTQAVLSANINSIAYANSADGTDGFTTVYPNLNLLTDTRDFINKNLAGNNQKTSIVSPSSKVLKDGNDTYLNFISTANGQDWFRAYLVSNWSTTPPPDFINANILPNTKYTFSFWAKGTGSHIAYAWNAWTTPSNTSTTFTLTNEWKYYSFTVTSSATIPVKDVEFFLRSVATGTEINLKYPKVEPGSTATPWMPSAREVTTADWPKYIGFSNTVKTNKSASDYTWFPVKDPELTNKVDSHVNNKANPHSVTAAQVGAYSKDESDQKLATQKQVIDSHVNNKSNPHAVTASQVGAYTKTESDSKLTDLSNKVIANKGNLASGTDLDNVIDIGTYRIGGLTGGTDIINVPSERSGTTIYAYLTVSGTTTSVVQELIVYDSKTVSQIYSRSRSGSTPTFSPWSKTVMADDSGKVTIKDLVVTATVKTVSIYNGGGQIILTRMGPMVQADIRSMPAIPANTTISGVIPDGYKPAADYTSITHSNNRLIFYANGSIKPDNNAMVSDNGYYSCSWVTKDATPTT